jgi:hypothetical protein
MRWGKRKEGEVEKSVWTRLLPPKNTIWLFAPVVTEVDASPRILMG